VASVTTQCMRHCSTVTLCKLHMRVVGASCGSSPVHVCHTAGLPCFHNPGAGNKHHVVVVPLVSQMKQ
jgi:hypothetical protein